MPRVTVTIVVVSYNSSAWLPACLESVAAARFDGELQVVVVDNASSDGSVELLSRRFPWVKLLANDANIGYARAVNQGWRAGGGDFLLVLNPDIVMQPDALQILHDHLRDHPDVGLVAPRLRNPDGSIQYSCRRHYTAATYLLRRTPLRALFPDHPVVRRHLMEDWDHDEIREVDWVLGAAMMLPRAALGDTVMDERYFMYFEDVDLCVRLQREGWKVVYHPRAEMLHHYRRASADGIWNRKKLEHLKSWVKFNLKHPTGARTVRR
jgi:GT2 family glycosyltransferase